MTLRSQVTLLLDEYKKATGKGNMIVANNTLLKVINLLVDHIETHSHSNSFTFTPNYTFAAAAVPHYVDNQVFTTTYDPYAIPAQGFNIVQPVLQESIVAEAERQNASKETAPGGKVKAKPGPKPKPKPKAVAQAPKRGRGRPKKVQD